MIAVDDDAVFAAVLRAIETHPTKARAFGAALAKHGVRTPRSRTYKSGREDDGTSDWVTVEVFAADRQISQGTVRNAIRDGRLPSTKIVGARRIPRDAEIAPRRPKSVTAADRAERRLGLVPGGGR